MATTSSIDLPTSRTESHRVDAPVWAFHSAVAWLVWGINVTRWAVKDARLDFRAVHLIPAAFAGLILLLAAYGLGLSA